MIRLRATKHRPSVAKRRTTVGTSRYPALHDRDYAGDRDVAYIRLRGYWLQPDRFPPNRHIRVSVRIRHDLRTAANQDTTTLTITANSPAFVGIFSSLPNSQLAAAELFRRNNNPVSVLEHQAQIRKRVFLNLPEHVRFDLIK